VSHFLAGNQCEREGDIRCDNHCLRCPAGRCVAVLFARFSGRRQRRQRGKPTRVDSVCVSATAPSLISPATGACDPALLKAAALLRFVLLSAESNAPRRAISADLRRAIHERNQQWAPEYGVRPIRLRPLQRRPRVVVRRATTGKRRRDSVADVVRPPADIGMLPRQRQLPHGQVLRPRDKQMFRRPVPRPDVPDGGNTRQPHVRLRRGGRLLRRGKPAGGDGMLQRQLRVSRRTSLRRVDVHRLRAGRRVRDGHHPADELSVRERRGLLPRQRHLRRRRILQHHLEPLPGAVVPRRPVLRRAACRTPVRLRRDAKRLLHHQLVLLEWLRLRLWQVRGVLRDGPLRQRDRSGDVVPTRSDRRVLPY